MDQQSRYLKDTSGFNPSNLVKVEPHFLNQQVKNRVVVPREGAFFSKTVLLHDRFKNRNLIRGKDFVCAGLRVELTQELGQEIYSFVIIINDEVSHSVAISYRTVGAEAQSLPEPTVETLETDFSDSKDIPLSRVKEAPKKFEPTFHYQDLGDIDKFEYMLFSLEKIRLAMVFDSKEVFKYVTHFEEYLNRLAETSVNFFQEELYRQMRNYHSTFKKALFNLGLVENLPPFLGNDGTLIASSPRKIFQSDKEAYFTLEALTTYSRRLYELLVNVEETGLGASTEFKGQPSVDKFEALPIGAQFTIEDYSFASLSSNPLVDLFYPDRLDKVTGYVIRKLTVTTAVHGSMFLYVGRDNSKTYVMRLVKTDQGYSTHFNKIANLKDSPPILSLIQEHIESYQNPHLDDKRDVDLSQVENLPLATMEDVVCNIPARKYITLTQLFSYMKRFKTGKKEISEIYENFSDKTVARRLQTLFSPCGAWDDNADETQVEMCKPAKVETSPVVIEWSVVPDVDVISIDIIAVTTTTTTMITQTPVTTTTTPVPTTSTTTTTTSTTTTTTSQEPLPMKRMFVTGFILDSESYNNFNTTGVWSQSDFALTYEEFSISRDRKLVSNTSALVAHLKMFGLDDYENITFKLYDVYGNDSQFITTDFSNTQAWLSVAKLLDSAHPLSGAVIENNDTDTVLITLAHREVLDGGAFLVILQNNIELFCTVIAVSSGANKLLGVPAWYIGHNKLPLLNWQANF